MKKFAVCSSKVNLSGVNGRTGVRWRDLVLNNHADHQREADERERKRYEVKEDWLFGYPRTLGQS
jgi:hypothetical protein